MRPHLARSLVCACDGAWDTSGILCARAELPTSLGHPGLMDEDGSAGLWSGAMARTIFTVLVASRCPVATTVPGMLSQHPEPSPRPGGLGFARPTVAVHSRL